MRTTTFLHAAGLLALLGLLAIPAPAQQQADPSQQPVDPVVEAARKARAKEKADGKPKHVFTNDDMPTAPDNTPAASAPVTAAADSNGTQATDSGDKKDKDKGDDPKSEAYWRKRFKEAHDKLANAERELGILQRELNKNEVQYYPNPQEALAQQYNRSDINEGQAKIQAKQFEVEKLKKDISDLEDELRKAGGDPGWAR